MSGCCKTIRVDNHTHRPKNERELEFHAESVHKADVDTSEGSERIEWCEEGAAQLTRVGIVRPRTTMVLL
jgi:hypothetical protein